MVKVKICGITNLEDARAAIESGADTLGFVFARSPRQVTPEQAGHIVTQLPPFVCKVGVFVDSDIEVIREIMSVCGLDLAQLHGSEDPDYCKMLFPHAIKSFRVRDESVLATIPQYKASAYLLDSYDTNLRGGTGQSFNWDIAKKAKRYGPIILAGGLTADNVRQAIATVQPYAVDVSSGVEAAPGKKDHAKLRTFLEAVKKQ
mgnify:CR=1 FL=1